MTSGFHIIFALCGRTLLPSLWLATVMKSMLTNPNLQQLMVVKGVERAKQFRWDESARKHVEVFKHAVVRRGELMQPQPAFSYPAF